MLPSSDDTQRSVISPDSTRRGLIILVSRGGGGEEGRRGGRGVNKAGILPKLEKGFRGVNLGWLPWNLILELRALLKYIHLWTLNNKKKTLDI